MSKRFFYVRLRSLLYLFMLPFSVIAQQEASVPGELVDIGGYKLHINCTGTGSPTIVLDSGTGGFSLEWIKIQAVLSKQHRVCSYDRAGYGWSEFGPLPRSSKRIASELNLLLTNSQTPGPYVLVGHSFGGYTAQYFAREYPEKAAAIVLVESSHPEQAERLSEFAQTAARKTQQNTRSYTVTNAVLHENYPEEVAELASFMISSWKHTLTWREEMKAIAMSGKQISRAKPMPDIPVVVITRGIRVWPDTERGIQMERVWMQLQDELSALGNKQGVHLIAEDSGHSVHLDQPVYVLNALSTLLAR